MSLLEYIDLKKELKAETNASQVLSKLFHHGCLYFRFLHRGAETGGSWGQMTPGNLNGVKHMVFVPQMFGKISFLVHRLIDSEQNH